MQLFGSFDPGNRGLHWSMYCGNDVIEGRVRAAVPVPNVAGLAVLGLMLLGMGAFMRRQKDYDLHS